MPDSSLYLLTFLLYAALAAWLWRAGWASCSSAPIATPVKLATAVPLVLHAGLLGSTVFGESGVNFSIVNALSSIAWLVTLIYWLAGLRRDHMERMLALVLPLAALSVALPWLFPSAHVLPHAEMPLFRAHLAISMLAYSLLSIAALHAALMALVERRLHDKHLSPLFAGMPPLLSMERLLFQIIGAGFILLTLSLGSGILFTEEIFHKALRLNHKAVFGILSWITFAALLAGRLRYGWRGKIAIRWTLSGFGLLLLAYIGSKFVLEVLLQRV